MSHRNPCAIALPAVLLGVGLMHGAGAAEAACDRQCLQQFVGDYATALIKHDPSALRVAPGVKVSENSVAVKLGEGPSWKGLVAFKSQPQYVADVAGQEVGYLGVVDDAGKPAFLALRLKIEKNQISEIESVLTHEGEGGPAFEPEGMIYREAPYIRDVPPAGRGTREQLIKVANTFWDVSTSSHDASKVPYAQDCWHFENGMNTDWERPFNAEEVARMQNPAAYQPQADGRIWTCARETYLTTTSWKAARQRHFTVDPERGLILTIANVEYPGRGAPVPAPAPQTPGAAATAAPAGFAPVRNVIDGPGTGPIGMSAAGMRAAMSGQPYVTAHYMLMRIVDGRISREQDVMRVLPAGTERVF